MKKANNFIGILIAILGISIIIYFVAIYIAQKNNVSSYFNKDDNVHSEKVYTDIMELDEDTYPQTPEEVLELYLKGLKLMYGNKIKKLDIIPKIIEKQRLLLSEEILEKNDFQTQIELVNKNIKFLEENKIKLVSTQIKNTVYQNDLVYINVINKDNLFQSYNFKYFLEKDENNYWKIKSWSYTE